MINYIDDLKNHLLSKPFFLIYKQLIYAGSIFQHYQQFAVIENEKQIKATNHVKLLNYQS